MKSEKLLPNKIETFKNHVDASISSASEVFIKITGTIWGQALFEYILTMFSVAFVLTQSWINVD